MTDIQISGNVSAGLNVAVIANSVLKIHPNHR